MATCTKCSAEIPGAELYKDPVDGRPFHRTCYFGATGSPTTTPAVPAGPPTAGGSTFMSALIGTLALAAGLWFLFNPGIDVGSVVSYGQRQTEQVVNLQRLAIGETFTLVGAIFLAFAMRPR